jgi:hypothetical protein
MSYLLIGISIVLLNLNGCQQEVEYRLDTEFVYVNQSDKFLSFEASNGSSNRRVIALSPNSSDTVYYAASGGFENPDPNSCCQGLLGDILGGALTLTFTDSICSLSSPLDINNYVSEKVEDRYFRYTFTFTEEVLNKATGCQ